MAKYPLRLILLCCYFSSVSVAAQRGQSAIDAAGGSKTFSDGNTYEFAIGQTISGPAYLSSSLVVTPGVLQPAANSTTVKPLTIAGDDLQVYPSPADHTLFLQPAFGSSGMLQYSLLDAEGKTVLRGEAALKSGRERQSLEVTSIAAGQYLLQVRWISDGRQYTSGHKVEKLK